MTRPLTPPASRLTLFITGTDTGVGKTRAVCAMIRRARENGLRVAGFKPVASGADITENGLRNDDALALLKAMEDDAAYDDVNPYCFGPPIAPHLAARAAGITIDTAVLDAAHARLATARDLVIVEGAGGWLVPLDEVQTFGDWVGRRNWPVVLVVALRLGCISHALLTAESILRRTRFAGWIATMPPPRMDEAGEVFAELSLRLPAPCWGVILPGAHDFRAGDQNFDRWCRAI
jgi:dethiobiotin synthetase